MDARCLPHVAPRVAPALRPSDRLPALTAASRFPRSARLLSRAAYQAVFADGRRLSDPYFLLLAAPRTDGDGARLGMAIARRHARTAVERNRIKRLVRESFRARCEVLPALDIVVMLRAGTAGVDNATLRAGLIRLWDLLQGRDASSTRA